ncbi:RHS repeat domain-containing protein [Shewanella baltica]|uniref:RHS repeat domain-containing protein n=1 Tax=Shewanella baltica TaxID=62322 RepID=UPI000E02A592|nr:RHS repeat-associated core domain-containing protein [Shewanella baltica]SUI78375.1 Cell wall-associated polypeptide CWBP200 [Shewanella baltica]
MDIRTISMKFMMRLILLATALIALSSSAATVRYQHTDMLGSVIAESDSAGNIISRSHYEPFGKRMGGDKPGIGYTGHLQDEDLGLTYMQQRYYDPLIGRFYSNDPLAFRDVHSFNRYAYANNNPYKYVDPDGKAAESYLNRPQGVSISQHQAATGKAGGAIVRGPLGAAVQIAVIVAQAASDLPSGVPEIPKGLVGDQSDHRAGPNKSGNKHTSGVLTPENGGTGDYEQDLGTLTGGTRPAGPGDSAPPGSQIGENGIFGRPENTSGGSSIDIPANGDKPHETLHYPPKEQD